MTIGVAIIVVVRGCPLPSFYIQGDMGYKESPVVGYNYSPSMTLSLVFSNYKI
jgi:hypothetical protein